MTDIKTEGTLQPLPRKELAQEIHANAVAKGFWDDQSLSTQHYSTLIICELCEAVEAHRKGRRADCGAYKRHCARLERDYQLYSYYNDEERPERLRQDKARQFERYIKDTVEDELADAYIRILDLAEAKGWRLGGYRLAYRSGTETFTENIYGTIGVITKITEGHEFCHDIALCSIEGLAHSLGIDLLWHVRAKMSYNATRPRLHGKAY